MGLFQAKKEEIMNATKGTSNKKTYNETQFNELATALLNDYNYEMETVATEGGEVVDKVSTPVKDFRDKAITPLLTKAGLDKSEAQTLTETYEFPTLPIAPLVSEMIEHYTDAGKRFNLQPKRDLKASITMEVVEPVVDKVVQNPKTKEESLLSTDQHRKVKVESGCPDHLKHKGEKK